MLKTLRTVFRQGQLVDYFNSNTLPVSTRVKKSAEKYLYKSDK